jgi:hypothetical protein
MRARVRRLRSAVSPPAAMTAPKKGNFNGESLMPRDELRQYRGNRSAERSVQTFNPGSLFAAAFSTSPALDAGRFAARKGQQVRS